MSQEKMPILRFCLVGGLVFVFDFSMVWLFVKVLPRLAAIPVAYALAVTLHYLLNKFWVFDSRQPVSLAEAARYLLAVAATSLFTMAMAAVALRWFTDSVYVAKLFAIPPTMLLGYVLVRQFVFSPDVESGR